MVFVLTLVVDAPAGRVWARSWLLGRISAVARDLETGALHAASGLAWSTAWAGV
ncbi:MAG: hypothetical protein ACRDOP_11920 [Gaiellaceae bacterium]